MSWQLQEAKQKFSELVRRTLEEGPQVVTRHGEEVVVVGFYKQLYSRMDALEMSRSFTSRSVNEGFSGGEKKRNEILQLN